MKNCWIVFLCCILPLFAPATADTIGQNEKMITLLEEKPPSKEWSFAVLGDNRYSHLLADFMFEKVLISMGQDSFDFAINTGDFVNKGTEEEYLGYLKRIRLLKFPLINVLGNHDIPSSSDPQDPKLFKKYFGSPYFYFDYQNARFVILNNAYHDFGDQQRLWLDKTLAEAKDRLKFVFMHIPTFNPSRKRSYLIRWDGKPFEEIIKKNKVDLLFTGHLHLFHDTIYQGTRTIITGGGGVPLSDVPERGGIYHWVKVKVKGKTVQAQPVIIPSPLWARSIYQIFFFFNYDVRDHWEVYGPVFIVVLFLLLSIFLKIYRKKRGKR